jgi:hypothetical protein
MNNIFNKTNEDSTKLYVQYGAGNEAVQGWLNFDASPTLRIQKMPLIGRLLRSRLLTRQINSYIDATHDLSSHSVRPDA